MIDSDRPVKSFKLFFVVTPSSIMGACTSNDLSFEASGSNMNIIRASNGITEGQIDHFKQDIDTYNNAPNYKDLWVETRNIKIKLYQYQQQLIKLQTDDTVKQILIEHEEKSIALQAEELYDLSQQLEELQQARNKLCEHLRAFPNLTPMQTVTTHKMKLLIKINDDAIIISYLEQNNWNITKAMDQYHHDKYRPEYIWEWQNKHNQWIPFRSERTQKFNSLQNGEKYEYQIGGHPYIFHKQSKDSALLIDITRKYKVIDTSPEQPKSMPKFEKHMTKEEAAKLLVGDMIDHQHKSGKFVAAKVIERKSWPWSNVKIHYIGKGEKDDVWSNYDKELHKFAKYESISKRPAHTLATLNKGKYVLVNPIKKYPLIGWRDGRVVNMDHNSGQVQISYRRYIGGSRHKYWCHRDNFDEIRQVRFINCRKQKNHSSKFICAFIPGTIVTVEEIDGAHCRISDPCNGWIPFYAISGRCKLKKLSEIKTVHKVRRRHTENIFNSKGDAVEYPPFWNNKSYHYQFDVSGPAQANESEIAVYSDPDYMTTKLVTLDPNSRTYKDICNEVNKHGNIATHHKVSKIETIQNKYLWDRHCSSRRQMIKMIGIKKLNEKYLWGGSTKRIDLYSKQGFRREFWRNRKYADRAEGIELCRWAWQCIHYSPNKLLYCKVLCGISAIQSNKVKLTTWPVNENGYLYDSLVDHLRNPSLFYFHDDARIYPMFVVHFRSNCTEVTGDFTEKDLSCSSCLSNEYKVGNILKEDKTYWKSGIMNGRTFIMLDCKMNYQKLMRLMIKLAPDEGCAKVSVYSYWKTGIKGSFKNWKLITSSVMNSHKDGGNFLFDLCGLSRYLLIKFSNLKRKYVSVMYIKLWASQ